MDRKDGSREVHEALLRCFESELDAVSFDLEHDHDRPPESTGRGHFGVPTSHLSAAHGRIRVGRSLFRLVLRFGSPLARPMVITIRSRGLELESLRVVLSAEGGNSSRITRTVQANGEITMRQSLKGDSNGSPDPWNSFGGVRRQGNSEVDKPLSRRAATPSQMNSHVSYGRSPVVVPTQTRARSTGS